MVNIHPLISYTRAGLLLEYVSRSVYPAKHVRSTVKYVTAGEAGLNMADFSLSFLFQAPIPYLGMIL